MSGFVYIWFDRKHKRFYLGAHWGTDDDGYVCSNTWMKNSHNRRPEDFKRRILSRHETKEDMFLEESRLLNTITLEELNGVKYYNHRRTNHLHWSADPEMKKSVRERISATKKRQALSPPNKGTKKSEELKQKIREGIAKSEKQKAKNARGHTALHNERISKAKKGRSMSAEHRAGLQAYWDSMKGRTPHNKGKSKHVTC